MGNLTCYDLTVIDNDLYFFANEINGLFVKRGMIGDAELVDTMPEEDTVAKNLVSKIFAYNTKIICVPFYAKKIWIFDTNKKTWTSIILKDSNFPGVKFLSAFIKEEILYLLPTQYDTIIEINLLSEKVAYDESVFREYQKLTGHKSGIKIRTDIVLHENNVYATLCTDDYILKYNYIKKVFEWIKVPINIGGLSGIAFDGERYWISAYHSSEKVVIWDGNKKFETVEVNGGKKEFVRGISYWRNHIILKCKDYLLIYNEGKQVFDKENNTYLFTDTIDIEKGINYKGEFEYGSICGKLEINDQIKYVYRNNYNGRLRTRVTENDFFNIEDFIDAI